MWTWTHTDAYGIWPRSQDAIDRGLGGSWLEGPLDVRGAELRALIFRTGLAGTRLTMRGQPLSPGITSITLGDIPRESFPSADHRKAADAMLGWVVSLADGKRALSDDIVTQGGASLSRGEVAGWPLIVAKLVGTAIWAAAACYIAERYESTIARFGDHAANTVGLMKATSTATNLVEAHAAREVAAGQSLPWTPEETKVLDAAIAAQQTFSTKPVTPPDSHPSLGSGIGSFSTGAMVALAAVAYYLFGRRNSS